MQLDPDSIHLPKVPLWRRSAAFALDFVGVGIVCVLLASQIFVPAFIVAWLAWRVVIAAKNRGQTLGRYAFDIRVVDFRGRTPGLLELTKRESVLGLGAMLAWIGLVNLSPTAAWALLLGIPIAVDCGFAFTDPEQQQAFHDRWAQTLVAQTRRGYSLDLKIKRLLAQMNIRVRK